MTRRRYQRGSLCQRGKRQRVWVARYWQDVIKPDGTLGRMRKSIVLGTVSEIRTRRQAMQVLSERLGPINKGTYKPQSAQKLSEFVKKKWEPLMLPKFKYATQQHYRYLLGKHLLPAFGNHSLCDLDTEAIQEFLSAKLESGLSPKTVIHIRNAFGAVLGLAEKRGYLTGNPVWKTEAPGLVGVREINVLTPEQVLQLAEALSEPVRSLVLLLTFTGLRVGELLAMRWRNVDFTENLLQVKETVYDGHFDSPKSKRSARTIPLGPKTVAILASLRSPQANPNELVFATRTGKPLDRRNLLRREMIPACKKLGLPRSSWHSLRHCNATLLDGVGASVGTVQSLLGHASSEITRKIYLHAIPSEQRRAVEALEQLVIGPKWTQVDEPQEKGKFVIN